MALQGFWLADTFTMAFWLEAPPLLGERLLRPNARPVVGAPFRELERLLPEELDCYEEERVLRLPTRHGLPLLSHEPIGDGARLEPWPVVTAESVADCVFEYLYARGAKGLGGGMKWGSSLRYWRLLAAFAKRLYERQQYAPGVVALEGRYYPAWQAVLDEYWQREFLSLASRLPPICRALKVRDTDFADRHPEQLALSFIDACIDHLVRMRLLRKAPNLKARKRSNAPLYRQWLKSLKAGNLDYLNGPYSQVNQFAEEVTTWLSCLRPTGIDREWRLTFALRAPEGEHSAWRLGYLLQSVKNPSLGISAQHIWQEEGSPLARTPLRKAQEILLTDLGHATKYCPQIRDSLRTPCPDGCYLERDEVLPFLSGPLHLLRRHGYGVVLPEWWEESQRALGMRLTISRKDPRGQDRIPLLGVHELVNYRWDITLGDRALTEEEFRNLVSTKEALIYRDGRWLHLDLESLEHSVKFLEEQGTGGDSELFNVLKLGEELQQSGCLPLARLHLEDDSFASQLPPMEPDVTFRMAEPPPSFHGQLRPYQLNGFSWMLFVRDLGLGACLADDMGLGKTVQMIAVLAAEEHEGRNATPSLIVCPMSVVGNWVKEFHRFCPSLKVMVHHGNDREDEEVFAQLAAEHHVIVTTFNLVLRDLRAFRRFRWRNLILDEAQNIKNPATKQAAAIRSLQADQRFALTGTPVENRLAELWSIINFLNPGYLGNLSSFRRHFAVPIEKEHDRLRAELLQQMIRPFILRRLKSDRSIIRDLPEKQEMKVFCNLTVEQATLYQTMVDRMLESLGQRQGIERKGLVLSTLTKLKQITNHPVHFLRDDTPFSSERSGKLQRLEEMLEVVLAESDKALIFTQFAEIGPPLQKKLEESFGIKALLMDGTTPKLRRDEMVHAFQRQDGPPVFILSLKTGGFGLNLTAASHVFHFDRWWNPAVEDQATDRAFRIGQDRNVQVHKFISIGTVEEKIDQMIEDKKRLASEIVTDGESMLTELSTEQLEEIFSLTRDAVVE